ncbi:hypothetical protein WCD74_01650 [Actinomycetospora sp. OC33-EN08]|uniref:Uncharacterized protein n=1 Tax=Actinomycetospora aurantiaca TaxID=3129233 RepID=A0ABU8MGI8_9PSEU
MGRHHQRTARPAHLALGAGALVAMIGGSGTAVALASASAPASVSPVVVMTSPAPSAAPRTAAPATTKTVATTSVTPKKASTKPKKAAPVCDLSGPPEFGDPAHPNEITNRNCGYTDAQGRERSRDPWIDGQLLDAAGN